MSAFLDEPVTYVKGDQAVTCETNADVVKAVFAGFKPAEKAEAVEPAEEVNLDAPDEVNGSEDPFEKFHESDADEADDDQGHFGSDFR